MSLNSARILYPHHLLTKYALQDMSYTVYDENCKDVSLLDNKTLTKPKREGKELAFSVTLQGDASLIKTLQKLSGKREKPVGRRHKTNLCLYSGSLKRLKSTRKLCSGMT